MTTRLRAFAEAVQAELDDSSVEFRFDRIDENKHGQRRRVHWYRMGGQITAPDGAGGRVENPDDDDVPDDVTGTRSPALWHRQEEVQCVIFAEDSTLIEQLLDLLIVAINEALKEGSVDWQGYTWHENEINQRIPMCTLQLTATMPVREEQKPLREVTATEQTCEVDD